MSDRISRMADMNEEGLNELLIEILQTLKRHGQALLELTGDAEGLKSLLSVEQLQSFDAAKEKTIGECGGGFAGEVRLHNAAIERLRDT